MAAETSQEIDATAAGWAARIDRGPLSPGDAEALQAWLAGDTRRQGAFMRMRAISLYTERARALGTGFDPDAFATPTLDEDTEEKSHQLQLERSDGSPEQPKGRIVTRRRLLQVSGAAAAACAAGAVGIRLFGPGAHYDTELGQVSVVSLEDGSVMTLNTASKVAVRFTDQIRSVQLITGEALFDVAKDRARPFIVDAGGATIRAVGTSFTVSRLAGSPIAVLVREGIVEVRRPTAPASVRIAANMRAELAPENAELRPVTPVAVDRELAWREGRIAFEGQTLEEAATAFARYSKTRIVLDDASVRGEKITGLFAVNDPVSFARAAALSLGLHAEVRAGQVRISRSAG